MADSEVTEEQSADLLKNTPSNIARLEDVIEQCKGRQKYLAQTASPCDGEDVRWYFCKVPLAENELAASVPRTEMVGKGEYFRFGMRDSLALEASFLEKEEELLSIWWKEYGECSEAPSGTAVSTFGSQPPLYTAEEERVGVPVKGGLYEVDLAKRHCFPVYWSGENRRVLRGHWFALKSSLDCLPLREDIAEQLEFAYRCKVWHRRTFQPSGLFAARVEMQGFMSGLHALFTGEDDTWEAWLYTDASGFSSVVNLRGNGIKLRRGYDPSSSSKPTQDELRQQKEEEMDDYCSQVPVGHLVFMVHGVGQRMEKANLVDDVANFRQITASLCERHLTSYQRDTQRVLFIPCQWRKGLKLGGESIVEKITLDGVRGLRVMLSATAHDILYYMSPIYCQEIINSVSNQLNRLYKKFLKRNPGYDGKVSLYGHSLGSVLSYDILCHQDELFSPFPMESMYKEQVKKEEHMPDQSSESSRCSSSTDSETKNSSTITENIEPMFMYEEQVQKEEHMPDQSSESSQSSSSTHSETKNSSTTTENMESMFQEEITEDRPSVAHNSLNLEQDVESNLSTDLLFEENIPQDGPSEALAPEEKHLDSTSSENYEVCGANMDNLQENTANSLNDKEKLIKLLVDEVDSLKARIAYLESHCGDKDRIGENQQDDKELDASNSTQNFSQRLPEQVTHNIYTHYIKYTKLEFKVDTFFAVGSPLGVFLALRNIRMGLGNGRDYWQDGSIIEEMPACKQMFNIFHPFDPVAYRVEPLVCKDYINKRPVIVPYHTGGRRLHIGFQEFTEDLASRSHAVVNRFDRIRVKVLTACQRRNNDSTDDDTESSSEIEERSYGSMMMERLTGSTEGRIDHVLQDKTFEHQYVSAIGAHTNYWRDNDTALFILKHLYRDIPEEPMSPVESDNQKVGPKGRFYQKDALDEECPLTFSDKIHVKEFSIKVRKAMKKG